MQVVNPDLTITNNYDTIKNNKHKQYNNNNNNNNLIP